jgi:hypothetical protein
MYHRDLTTNLKWSLCRSGGDPEAPQFDSYGKAVEYLARCGLRATGRDTDVRVVYYAADSDD